MMQTLDEVGVTVTVVGFVPDEKPPAVWLVEHVDGPRGAARHFTQKIPVPDGTLFARLQTEVRVGDQINAHLTGEQDVHVSRFTLLPLAVSRNGSDSV